jgi:hypothetical protein
MTASDGERPPAHQASPPRPLRVAPGRRRWWLAGIASTLVLAVVVVIVVVVDRQPDVEEEPTLLIGLGPTADTALDSPLAERAPVHMLTTWFNEPEDLGWLDTWRESLIPQTYAEGYAHHLIVFNAGESGTTLTPYGPACGLLYPLSEGFDDDMRELAELFRGDGPLYVTMFSEFQTYPCEDNQWVGSENYYRALKDRYRAAVEIFHERNPHARVALGWGGWQHQYDDPSVGGGRSLIPYFADVMRDSDFQSFQAMDSDVGSNPEIMLEMTKLLAPYGPVMMAHYLPDDESAAVWDADIEQIFTDAAVTRLTEEGLFAFSFMDPMLLDQPARSDRAARAVSEYAADWLVPPALQAGRPPVVTPPVEEPPVEEPPVVTPPVEEPPVEEPPAEEPPVVEPPADEPPVVEPPADEPPVDTKPQKQPHPRDRISKKPHPRWGQYLAGIGGGS